MVEGKCEVIAKNDIPNSNLPVVVEHAFYCEHLYDPDAGALKQVSYCQHSSFDFSSFAFILWETASGSWLSMSFLLTSYRQMLSSWPWQGRRMLQKRMKASRFLTMSKLVQTNRTQHQRTVLQPLIFLLAVEVCLKGSSYLVIIFPSACLLLDACW